MLFTVFARFVVLWYVLLVCLAVHYVGFFCSHAASFKWTLLSVNVSVGLSVCP